MYERHIEERVWAALKDTPVVFVNGARQTGKTTLVKRIAGALPESTYQTFDDAAVLASAAHDPAGFIRSFSGTAIIDEVQKVPALFPAIKAEVDQNRKPGRFLLTGSADILLLPRISESLAGRMEIVTLWPLSQGELAGSRESFIDKLFGSGRFRSSRILPEKSPLIRRILLGGFPEVLTRKDEQRRRAWYGSYLSTILQRDVRDLSHIEGLTDMPRLLSLLAARIGGLHNAAEISRAAGLAHNTLKRYLTLLETTFLIKRLSPWHANLGKRLVKSPKLYLSDSGLASYLNGLEREDSLNASQLKGPLCENFVFSELLKQSSWSNMPLSLWYFRTAVGKEIDFILEDSRGRLSGIEVKASATIGPEDFSALKEWAGDVKSRFMCGIVLYWGDNALPFGNGFWALPLQLLWQ